MTAITDFEKRVLNVLENNPDGVTRIEFIQILFGGPVPSPKELANDNRDRRVRSAIENLRVNGVIISASSHTRGYRLATNQNDVDAYLREQMSRVKSIQKSVRAVKRAYGLKDQLHLSF